MNNGGTLRGYHLLTLEATDEEDEEDEEKRSGIRDLEKFRV